MSSHYCLHRGNCCYCHHGYEWFFDVHKTFLSNTGSPYVHVVLILVPFNLRTPNFNVMNMFTCILAQKIFSHMFFRMQRLSSFERNAHTRAFIICSAFYRAVPCNRHSPIHWLASNSTSPCINFQGLSRSYRRR